MKTSRNEHLHHATAELKPSCQLDCICLQSCLAYICKTATPKTTKDYLHYISLI